MPPQHLAPTREAWRALAATTPGSLLFESNLPDSRTLLFNDPHRTLLAHTPADLPQLLTDLDQALAAGHHVAGYLTYEAACALEGSPSPHPADPALPLAWFGLYAAPAGLPPAATPAEAPAQLPLCLELETPPDQYLARVAEAQQWIAAGDTYQLNLTTAIRSDFPGDPATLYTALAHQQPTAFSALLHPAPGLHILSLSPELLLQTDSSGRIQTRPMKGTATESTELADDKNRAEHIMIVDLLRNDLNRVSTPGSVTADPLFAVEPVGPVLQMTSTISGRLRPATPLSAILRAILPPGSMTGAPKRRSIQLLQSLEPHPRGVYSGAIGFAAPAAADSAAGSATFSVPIRTVTLVGEQLRMGVGGAVVADSTPAGELDECWLKAAFLHRAALPFSLVETLAFRDGRFLYLESHLDRLEPSAAILGYPFSRDRTRTFLLDLGHTLTKPHRVRLTVAPDGMLASQLNPLDLWPDPVTARLVATPVRSNDTFLNHKTTYRPVYDREIAISRNLGFAEALFTNERGELTEGCISSLLLQLDGRWLTPALSSGVLPGVARGRLLASAQITEQIIALSELHRATAAALCNGIRGIAPLTAVTLPTNETLRFPTTPIPLTL